MEFTATYERSNVDQEYTKVFDCPSIEDATIEAVCWAELKGDELLSVEQN